MFVVFDQFSEGRSATLFDKIVTLRPLRPKCSMENDRILILSLYEVFINVFDLTAFLEGKINFSIKNCFSF